MRLIIAALLSLCLLSPAKASVYTVNYPFSSGPLQLIGDIPNPISIGVGLQSSVTFTDPNSPLWTNNSGFPFQFFLVTAQVNGTTLWNYRSIGAPAPCIGCPLSSGTVQISDTNRTIGISFGFQSFGTGHLDNASVTLSLPDGIGIAGPVPEPSTWAMMIIGFATLGGIAFIRRQPRVA